jgi:hypothetical protein
MSLELVRTSKFPFPVIFNTVITLIISFLSTANLHSPSLIHSSIDGSFVPWSITLRQRLLEQYPLPEGLEPIPDDVLLDPNWLLEFADSTSPAPQNGTTIPSSDDSLPSPDLLPIPNSLTATITSNVRITPPTHWQDVRHLKLSTSPSHPYVPGSTLTIYPKNFPVDVTQFLSIMEWTSIADLPLKFSPSSTSTPPTSPLPIPNLSSITLRSLLTNHLDILSIPRRSFFAHLAHYTTDPFQRERLLEFTDPQYIDELYDYTTRPRRSILEVLQEFETVKVPWQRICSLIPVIRGRQFSIASADQGRGEVELLIAIVKYKTVIKRVREGVCTRYIAALKEGDNVSVTMARGGLGVEEKDVERPVVMVGPGTGVAPMRSLVYQRMMWREKLGSRDAAKDLLFFGCRNADADFFFKDEWSELQDKGVPLSVWAAFSRDQVRVCLVNCQVHLLIRLHSAKRSTSKTYFDSKARWYTTLSRTKTASCTSAARRARCPKRFAKRSSRCSSPTARSTEKLQRRISWPWRRAAGTSKRHGSYLCRIYNGIGKGTLQHKFDPCILLSHFTEYSIPPLT